MQVGSSKMQKIAIMDKDMFQRSRKRKLFIQRIIAYVASTLAVLTIVTVAVLFIQGYRLDGDHGRLERGALLQFRSVPGGASIIVDGKTIGSRTPAKYTVLSGSHSFGMEREGYRPWAKILDIKAGTLNWLDYVRFIPNELQVSTVDTYSKIADASASLDRRYILVQEDSSRPTFKLVDVSGSEPKTVNLTLPISVYSAGSTGSKHAFSIESWDGSGRYVILKHQYDSNVEWIVMDINTVNNSRNATSIMGIKFGDLRFIGNNNRYFFALVDGNLRKVDLGAKTLSASLVARVQSFKVNENIVSYVGLDASGKSKLAGIYRDGDESSYTLRTVDGSTSLSIASSKYRNDFYVAISEGKKVDILEGDYPRGAVSGVSSLSVLQSFDISGNADTLMFNSGGSIVVVKSGNSFKSYEIEYDRLNASALDTRATDTAVSWIDNAYLWSSYDDLLTIREYDGANVHTLNAVSGGYDVVLTTNGQYLYSFNKSGNGFILQRAKLILE